MIKFNDKLVFIPIGESDHYDLDEWNGGAIDTINGVIGQYFYHE